MNGRIKRVLVVEDQRLVAADLEDTLRRLGYDVVGNVASGEEALVKANEVGPDLVLLDIRLAGVMDGIQAARIIRERMDIPIIYLTAYADEETVRRAMVTGPYGYLMKPFNERELRAAIDIAIYKHASDRTLAEERARRMVAEEFKLFVEGVEDYAICLLDLAGRVTTWNIGAERIKGYSPVEIVGRHLSTFYTPEEIAAGKPEADLAAAAERGRIEHEGLRVRKDGSRFWAMVSVSALRDEEGRTRGFAKITRDVSARRAAELERERRQAAQALLDRATLALAESLDESETLQRAAHAALPDLADLCLVDLADEGGELGRVAAAHLDPQQNELAGRLGRASIVDRGLPNGVHHVFRSGESAIHPTLEAAAEAAQLLGADDPEVVRELGVGSYICVPIQLRGTTQGVLNLLRTGRARPYTTQDLSVAEELARRIGLAVDNARLFRDAREAIRARDEFLSIASHELKTPLTPLQMQLAIIERRLKHVDKADLEEWLAKRLGTVQRQADRLERLVGELLDISRIVGGRLRLEPEALDLAQVVRELLSDFQGRGCTEAARCQLRLEGPGAIVGRWDRMRLEQIVTNLVSNALKYGQGQPVTLRLAGDEHSATLIVQDRGIGISPEDQERIFGRFERAVSTRHYGGFGLGLFIVRQVVAAMGGEIWLRSQLGHGATFGVRLPRGLPSRAETTTSTEARAAEA